MALQKTKPKRKGRFIVRSETWAMEILFVIGHDSKYLGKYLQKVMGSVPADLTTIDKPTCSGRTYFRNSSEFVIYLKHWPTTIYHYGVVQHELFHAVDQCLRNKGIKLSDDSDEAYAYLLESLTRKVYKKIW